MFCPYCGKNAEFVDNKEIYGRRYGKSYMMWWCKNCDARVGVHHNDKNRPLGSMANKELRIWRMKSHFAIDKYWKKGKYKRGEVYMKLKEIFGKDIHIGQSDKEICQQIINIVPHLFKKQKYENN